MDKHLIDYSDFELYRDSSKGRRSGWPQTINLNLQHRLPQQYLNDIEFPSFHSNYQESKCIYCSSTMTKDTKFDFACDKFQDETIALLGVDYKVNDSLFFCPQCYWWVFKGYTDRYTWGGEGSEGRDFITNELLLLGKIKTYNLKDEDLPIKELRSWLARHPDNLAHTNPHAFEKLMADCFKDLYPEAEVMHVGKKTNDKGVDIKVILNNDENILVQVKRRENIDKSEGVKTIRELNGVLLREGIAQGMVVTTAKKFTKAAIEETTISDAVKKSIPFQRYKVDLIDYTDVVKLLNIQAEDKKLPWHKHSEVFKNIPYRDKIITDESLNTIT